ncbi:SGNH/GDSL hydrolase family protein [Streptomyces sp. B27]|uniref:SGNH/GDSL hydrolase family protein n=1 Tax=Streptomyces sp. B27 TaxID=2485015 RepID=UPI000FD8A139|nr:SGNH/GDSL hydrolase family protein [Streptomyces sp. B27]
MGKNKSKRTPVMLALAGLLASLIALVPSGTASAAESIPELQWPAVAASRYGTGMVTSPTGSVTMPCSYANSAYFNLKTYSATGQLNREIPATQSVDGVPNCIEYPVVDKNDDVYGVPAGYVNGSFKSGPIVAYDGNTEQWRYPTGCTSTYSAPVVGADGNIYFVNGSGRLIGLTPDVVPPRTQPEKILDVQVQGGGCGKRLHVFKDGLAMEWYYSQKLTYYTYGGKNLGSPSGDYDNDSFTLNAAGRLFYPTFVGSGSMASFTLSAYDPTTQKVAWTAQSSSFGQYGAAHVDTLPTPDGGTYVIVQRKKVVGGVETSERINALVKINTYGLKVWDKELPNQDANGNSYSGVSALADVSGKIAVVREGQLQTSDGYYRRAISIGVFNPDGTVAYSEVMRGNLNRSEGSTFGYYANQFAVGQNALPLMVERCYSVCSSPDSDTKLYPIKVPGLGLDYPRGAVLTMNEPQQPAASSYVAMGDSYSSGEGVEPFEGPSNQPGYNECHRSENAYSKLVSRSPTTAPYLDWGKFVACSGATTNEVINPNAENHEVAQVDALSATTKYVSITIGGNDIGFVDFGTACVLERCAVGTDAYNTALDKINNILSTRLKATYEQILAKAPNAEIYVLGYPQVAPVKTESDGYEAACDFLWPDHWSDARAARDIVTRLNSKIEETVTTVRQAAAGNTRLTYVEVNGADSPFEGHTMCPTAGDSYFHNLDQWVGHPAYALHPNAQGQAAYAEILMDALTN